MNPKPKSHYRLLLVFMIFCVHAHALENYLSGSRMTAISNCGVAIPDIWSVSHNQAGIAFLTKTGIAVNHQQRFLLKELGLSSLAFILPSKTGSFGFHTSYFGYSRYHETKTGFSYALKLSPKIAAGIQLDYFRTAIPSNTYVLQTFTFEAGIMAFPMDNLSLGLHVFNPVPEKWSENRESELPLTARIGAGYLFDGSFRLSGELRHHSKEEEVLLSAGMEYFALRTFALRAGISGGDIQYSFGFGYTLKRFRADIAFAKHRILGTSPSIDFIYEW